MEIEQYEKGYYDGYNDADRTGTIKDLKTIAEHYGFTSQANMLCEESAEFMVALNKLRRGNTEAYENIKEELADVLVIALQLREIIGAKAIDDIMSKKIKRQLERIEGERRIGEDVKQKMLREAFEEYFSDNYVDDDLEE